ncbi:glycoside hydrolase family 78 protein [Halobacillus naozhouensis]|uniref:alpha-L-rhamnosidase n=1 Tax=Halobacillus naozhouensis TaxID=554880 RepID=A0ABY8J3K6_9BACI|nr:glycoside hydrolase family 78 protein [Halobacillus naozhouensis]WFT75320.1 glycoside hydrolase family 78 protein [Halobacillus naozhouensis]
MIEVKNLTCEYFKEPLGLDTQNPRISWQIESDKQEVKQSAYQLQVSKKQSFENPIYDQRFESHESILNEIKDLKLDPFTRYYFRVKIWCQGEVPTDWSPASFWETGFMNEEWEGEWITAPEKMEKSEASPYLYHSFNSRKEISQARVYATSLGVYELSINGSRVGDQYFSPGWTSYHNRIQYQAYDVTEYLTADHNEIGVSLGNGWYKGPFGFEGKKEIYGDTKAALVELHITYGDGTKVKIVTNKDWQAVATPILMSEIYHGETYDARLEDQRNHNVETVEVVNYPKHHIIHQQNEPVRKIDELIPLEIFTTREGDTVLDMGQNMVGWIKFNVRAEKGHQIALKHAEILDEEGNIYFGNLRKAEQKITYTCKGGGQEVFEPHFTFQGFRYVKLINFPEDVDLSDFTGEVLHSDMERTGDFETSNPLVNQLHHNIVWGQKGNFLDVPTDCPQRDERLGWTGDAQMFFKTASYLRNVGPFFNKWLKDLIADQLSNGGVPYVIPDIISKTDGNLGGVTHSVAAWGDAAVIIPWTLYVSYGDKRILEEQYSSMKAWVEYMRSQGEDENLWDTGFQLGDWLGLDSEPDTYTGVTDKTLIATAFFAYSTQILIRTAKVLELNDDLEAYEHLYKKIKDSYQDCFLKDNGSLQVQTQTAHVLTLMFNLVDKRSKEKIAADLVTLIEQEGVHLTTGFVGTPYLNLVLSENGYHYIASRLFLQKDYPSWLYQVTKGATTVWEHWDSIKPDGSFWSDDMNSFNHYAYGSIGEWMYKVLAGIDTDQTQPGYKHIHLAPKPGAELTWLRSTYHSMYGEIGSSWTFEGEVFTYNVSIPANTTATVTLPGAASPVKNQKLFLEAIGEYQFSGENVIVHIGSGNYKFQYEYNVLEGSL